jgi:hypothetical protein
MVTAYQDWERLDIAQFEVEADTRDEAIEIAKKQLATGSVPWVVGEMTRHDDGFVVTPEQEA